MAAVWSVLGAVLLLFELVLLARVAVDWVAALSTGPAPGWSRPVRRVTHAVTEPVLAPVRRVLRPVHAGSVAIDLAVPAVFLAVLLLRSLVLSL